MRLREFFQVPGEIRREFWQETLQKNSVSLLVVCVMIFGMEAFNMARVLFWSDAGLGTRNNRIYFGMYCALWASAAAYGTLLLSAGGALDSGAWVNLTITAVVALAVSLTRCRHAAVMLSQRPEISRINRRLHLLLQKDPLTGLLNKAAFQQEGERVLAQGAAAFYMVDLDDFKAVNAGMATCAAILRSKRLR